MHDVSIATLVEQRLDLLADREKLDKRIEDVDALLIPALAERGGRFELPGLPGQGFALQQSRGRFSADKFRELVGELAYSNSCIFPPSSKTQAAQVVGSAIVDQCMVVTSDRPTVRKLTERRRG